MRRLLMAGLMIVCAACLNEDVVGSSTATGMYSLRTINDSQLPYKLPASGTTQTEVLGDTITLFQGNTYAEKIHVRVTANGQVTTETREDAGSYTFFNITVTLTSGRGRPERRGRIEETSMIIIEEGLTSVYRK